MRLDQYLVSNNFFTSRNKAQEAIKENAIYVNNKLISKPSYEVLNNDLVEIKEKTCPYVSRGGYKLEEAIKSFNLDFNDKVILDIGSSTGGFTDCALQNNAKLVYSVDVGTNQMSDLIKNDKRIVLLENTNILDLDKFDFEFDYLVMDVSFVSIYKLIPALNRFLNDNNNLVCLIKPQFEAGKMINKGVIKDMKTHISILNNVLQYLTDAGLYINKLIPSPIKGGSGNIEFLALISKNKSNNPNINQIVKLAYELK